MEVYLQALELTNLGDFKLSPARWVTLLGLGRVYDIITGLTSTADEDLEESLDK